MKPIRIALGDLRHRTLGRQIVFMPVGIGYIASYTISQSESNSINVQLYDNPETILKDIEKWKPHVVALSNYCWNSDLSCVVFRYAKKMDSSIICISGGPEFPTDHPECAEYLLQRKEIDFYVYLEGEVAFSRLINKIQQGIEINSLKSQPQSGIMSIHPETGNLVVGDPIPRLMNMDDIPSPYLNGLMEKWFNGKYAPSIETARGCPFSCAYCFTGQSWYKPLATFSVQRIKQELTYIAQQMKPFQSILLSICDSNFGMYKRDEEIAEHIRSLQDEVGWPNFFNVSTGKANYDRILRIASRLKNKMEVTSSVQSLNPKTLEVIKRKNFITDDYLAEITKRRLFTISELIVPLPEETKDSFFEGVKYLIRAGIQFAPYTTMILRGTYLASKECQERYRFQTKFRILPKQIGEYVGEKIFEIEEVCVATNTMSYDDYLECRGFAFVTSFFTNKQFDIIGRHVKELGIDIYEYLYCLWELVKSGNSVLSKIYNRYLGETHNELFSSKASIYKYFTKEKNYKKLLTGELGDNLIRKYQTEMFLKGMIVSIELAYSALEEKSPVRIAGDFYESLNDSKNWILSLRNISTLFESDSDINTTETLQLRYDVNEWYLLGDSANPLITYKKPVNYQISYNRDNIKRIFDEAKELYGTDISFQLSKLLTNCDINNFWRKCEAKK
jgi:radical SAM superfamily enzyme YgiQ (UPF0313 family)